MKKFLFILPLLFMATGCESASDRVNSTVNSGNKTNVQVTPSSNSMQIIDNQYFSLEVPSNWTKIPIITMPDGSSAQPMHFYNLTLGSKNIYRFQPSAFEPRQITDTQLNSLGFKPVKLNNTEAVIYYSNSHKDGSNVFEFSSPELENKGFMIEFAQQNKNSNNEFNQKFESDLQEIIDIVKNIKIK